MVGSGPREHGGGRQNGKGHVCGWGPRWVLARPDIGDEVAVREHDAFRASRRAGSEANRGQRRIWKCAKFGGVRRSRQQRGDRGRLVARIGPHDMELRQGSAGLLQRPCHSRAFHDENASLGILDAPGDIFGIVVDVERHDHQAEAERRKIDGNPVDTVLHAQCNAVTLDQSQRRESRLPASDERR